MLRSKKASFLRGHIMRATRLDRVGRPIVGDESVVTSEGFISVAYTANNEEGEAIAVTTANGKTCVSETATPSFNGYGMEIQFCEVDFALFTLLTGQEVIIDPQTGDAVGFKMESGVDVAANPFALELWMGAVTDATPSENSEGFYGYVLTPFLNGGTVGDFTVENAAITFTVSNLSTKTGSNWGAGPHEVQLGADGTRSVLTDPVSNREHLRSQIVEVAPPAAQVGARPLLDLSDPDVTAISAAATGLAVDITPTPAGTDPMWYDLGDGTWDYAETGSYSHTYAAAGTYTIVGYRGGSSASTTVTVSA